MRQLALALVLLVAGHHAAAQSVTFTSSPFALHDGPDCGPTCVAVADVNGDNTLTVLTNDGTNKSLTLPSPTGNLFFRLFHP